MIVTKTNLVTKQSVFNKNLHGKKDGREHKLYITIYLVRCSAFNTSLLSTHELQQCCKPSDTVTQFVFDQSENELNRKIKKTPYLNA